MRTALVLPLLCCFAGPALAHEGPPFPIVMDEPVGPYKVSVWTDPDVGTGTFFVILEPGKDSVVADDLEVQVCVRPQSGRLEEACHKAVRQRMRHRVQYYAEVPLDQQEMWDVRVTLRDGAGQGGEVKAEVEATPPGFGAWDLLIYLFPFALVGVLWVYGVWRHSRAERRAAAQPSPELPTAPPQAASSPTDVQPQASGGRQPPEAADSGG